MEDFANLWADYEANGEGEFVHYSEPPYRGLPNVGHGRPTEGYMDFEPHPPKPYHGGHNGYDIDYPPHRGRDGYNNGVRDADKPNHIVQSRITRIDFPTWDGDKTK